MGHVEDDRIRLLEEMDETAYRLAKEWYLHPAVAGLDRVHGIRLGEMAEYAIIPVLIAGIKGVADGE